MVSLTAILLPMGATAELRFGSGGRISVFLIFLERNRKKRGSSAPESASGSGERRLENGAAVGEAMREKEKEKEKKIRCGECTLTAYELHKSNRNRLFFFPFPFPKYLSIDI